MKYSRFAFLAGAFAIAMCSGPAVTASIAKSASVGVPVPESVQVTQAADRPVLYAQANLVEISSRASQASKQEIGETETPAPMNVLALVAAGMAVMGSLAFRRSPNK
jgi:hypothetical protein